MKRIVLLPGQSMTIKRIQIFTQIAHSLNMKILDLDLLKESGDDSEDEGVGFKDDEYGRYRKD